MPSPCVPPAPPERCPLCDQPNDCAACRGDASACWCMTARIDPAALARVPATERGLRCLCPRCAAAVPEATTPAPTSQA